MSRYISPVPLIQDVNGKPIVGAKLFFFEPGTTTLKTIYADSGLATPLNNPVLSDANGQYTDNIFLDGIYKNVQQDNNGVTIWTKDPIGDVIEGQFELWLNDNTYNVPEIVRGSNDEYYQSIVDGNQGNDPTVSPTKWESLRLGRIWTPLINYSIGDPIYGSNGLLYTSLTNLNAANDPTTDVVNWTIAVDHAQFAIADGTGNAITATFNPVIPALKNGLEVRVRAISENSSATPTFSPDGITAKNIVRWNNAELFANDILGAGHELILRYNSTSDNWHLLNPAATTMQIVKDQDGELATGTTILPHDDTIPQITEGDEYMAVTIAPKSAGSNLVVEVVAYASHSSASYRLVAALFINATADALAAGEVFNATATIVPGPIVFRHTLPASSTTSRTYRVRIGSGNAGTTSFNGESGARRLGGVYASSLTVTEVRV